MKKNISTMVIVALLCTGTAQAQRYKVHTTANTKTMTLRGGPIFMGCFSEGLAVVSWEKGWFVINDKGEKVFDLPKGYEPALYNLEDSYYRIKFDSGRLMITKKNGAWTNASIIDTTGKVIKSFTDLYGATQFKNGVAVIGVRTTRNGFNGEAPWHIDKDGNVLSKTIAKDKSGLYYKLDALTDGMRYFRDAETGKCGYYDAKCNVVIPAKFKNCDYFSEGMAAAQDDDEIWGYIDKSGEFVIAPMFTYMPGEFHSGYARVQDKKGNIHYIDKKGNIAWSLPTNWIYSSFNDKGLLIAGHNIFNTSFKKVATFNPSVAGGVWQYNDEWFVVGSDVFDEKQIFDYQGNHLLNCDTDRYIYEGIARHRSRPNDCYYYNLKGEIIIQFKDTQF